MKLATPLIILFGILLHGHAAGNAPAGGAEKFVRQVVKSYLESESKITFPIADKLFAIDNGETITKEELQNAWPRFARKAFKQKVSLDQFFRDVELKIGSPRDNTRLMSNERVLQAYSYQDGDLYCDASQVKAGAENFIAYDKAFIYIIRKIDGQWTLIGIGG